METWFSVGLVGTVSGKIWLRGAGGTSRAAQSGRPGKEKAHQHIIAWLGAAKGGFSGKAVFRETYRIIAWNCPRWRVSPLRLSKTQLERRKPDVCCHFPGISVLLSGSTCSTNIPFLLFCSQVSVLVSPQGQGSWPPADRTAALPFTGDGSRRSSEMSGWMSKRDLKRGVDMSPPRNRSWYLSARTTLFRPLRVSTCLWKLQYGRRSILISVNIFWKFACLTFCTVRYLDVAVSLALCED